MGRNRTQSHIFNLHLAAAAAQSFFYGAFTTGVFSACQSMGVVGVSAGVTGKVEIFYLFSTDYILFHR